MQLKQDFHDILSEAPTFPSNSIKDTFKLMEHMKLSKGESFWNSTVQQNDDSEFFQQGKNKTFYQRQ